MPDIGLPELLIIMGILVFLFGAGRVAELGGALGRAVREFRRAVREEPGDGAARALPEPNGDEQPRPGYQH
ncbi:Sec-independent protein translocase protein TatA [bacterium HR24]|nr:Sec-independent protein translocase protein TatA [bacterium HR24]